MNDTLRRKKVVRAKERKSKSPSDPGNGETKRSDTDDVSPLQQCWRGLGESLEGEEAGLVAECTGKTTAQQTSCAPRLEHCETAVQSQQRVSASYHVI